MKLVTTVNGTCLSQGDFHLLAVPGTSRIAFAHLPLFSSSATRQTQEFIDLPNLKLSYSIAVSVENPRFTIQALLGSTYNTLSPAILQRALILSMLSRIF